MGELKIGLDWDGTVNADPSTFLSVVKVFLDAGHEIKVVTWRPEGHYPDMEKVFEEWGFRIPVIFCNGQAKRDFYDADIWIDDNPVAVSFSLERPPRFEEDPEKYAKDVLVCSREGFDTVTVEWGQLRPRVS